MSDNATKFHELSVLGPARFNGGVYLKPNATVSGVSNSLLDTYEKATAVTATFSGTGLTGNNVFTFSLTILGNLVTLQLSAASTNLVVVSVAQASYTSDVCVPARARPATAKSFGIEAVDNSTRVAAYLVVNADGTLTIRKEGAFTAGTQTIPGTTVVYAV